MAPHGLLPGALLPPEQVSLAPLGAVLLRGSTAQLENLVVVRQQLRVVVALVIVRPHDQAVPRLAGDRVVLDDRLSRVLKSYYRGDAVHTGDHGVRQTGRHNNETHSNK